VVVVGGSYLKNRSLYHLRTLLKSEVVNFFKQVSYIWNFKSLVIDIQENLYKKIQKLVLYSIFKNSKYQNLNKFFMNRKNGSKQWTCLVNHREYIKNTKIQLPRCNKFHNQLGYNTIKYIFLNELNPIVLYNTYYFKLRIPTPSVTNNVGATKQICF